MNIREDCSFMVGHVLTQICYGLYQLQLHFSGYESLRGNDLHFEVGHELECFSGTNTKKWSGDFGKNEFSMNELLDLAITDAFVDSNSDLHIYFENGDKIKINRAHQPCESYIVHYNKDFEVIDFDSTE